MRFYDEEIAIKYGIEAGVLYQHFLFWIKNNKANGRNYKEGRFWTYNSRSALLTQFPELTENKIRGALNRLVEAGILMRGCFNKFAWDRTTWFAFVEEPKELAEQPAGTIRDEDGNVIQNANVNSTKCSVIKTNESVIETDESVIETSVIGYNNQTIPYINPDNETDSNPSGGGKSVEMNNQPPAAAPSLEESFGKNSRTDEYDKFETDYLRAYNKITARTIMSINQIFKTGELREEFMSMFENARTILKAGYDYNTIIDKILPDLDFSNPKAKYEFHDYFRIALRNSAENLSKKASVSKVENPTVEYQTREQLDKAIRETLERNGLDVDKIDRQLANARKKIGEDDKQALFKKLGDMYKLE